MQSVRGEEPGWDVPYLDAIEEALTRRPHLAHHRVLFGPPRNEAMFKHLRRLLEIRDPGSRHVTSNAVVKAADLVRALDGVDLPSSHLGSTAGRSKLLRPRCRRRRRQHLE